jgi:hypothetical protein
MDLHAPFTGTLYMPDKEFLVAGSPVLLPDGRAVAAIRWHTWSQRFGVLDADGTTLAECRPQGMLRRRYTVLTRDGHPVVDLRPGLWRPFNGAEVTLASGRRLDVHQVSMWSDRTFEFTSGGATVGRITPTTGVFSFRPDSYAFEVVAPVMSALAAISLAQALRVVVRGTRQQVSSG